MPARIDPIRKPRRTIAWIGALVVLMFGPAADALATFYQVNSTADLPDANTATAACETATGNGVCTLRAAVQQANAHAGLDTILLPANTYVLGGVLGVSDSVTIIGSTAATTIIDANGAATGAGVFQLGSAINVSLNHLTIRNGVARGGIASDANLTVDDCVITDNSAESVFGDIHGGGIDNGGSLVLKNSIVEDNKTLHNGSIGGIAGGIHSSGPLTISNSTISGNQSAYGGGLYAEGKVTITNSTFSGNSATYGAAIYTEGSTMTLVNDTISGNASAGDGAGMFLDTGTIDLYSVTVAANEANADNSGGGGGAGLYNVSASVSLNNSILSGNYYRSGLFLVQADCAGTFTSSSKNLVAHPSCTINGPYSEETPLLGPLRDNGGPTATHALLPGSAGLDAGPCSDALGAPLAIDQRGVPRPQGGACDIGAFELEDLIFADDFEPGT
ncbi:MAG TPA: choice-of-anchor Q domain-containing protein [Rhodanobacteraceae bacterium]|nr:choice-of-anchor Q domain-containing protein [Rhodanobacteraceae bacterium]